MSSLSGSIGFTSATTGEFPIYRFFQALSENSNLMVFHEEWAIPQQIPALDIKRPALPYVVKSLYMSGLRYQNVFLWRDPPILVFVYHNGNNLELTVAAPSMELAQAEVKHWKITYPPLKETNDKIHVKFWFDTPTGSQSITRTLVAPMWSEIEQNYPQTMRSQMASLHTFHPDADSGQLLLWMGAPGTGKTYFLRSLLQSWKSWAKPHFIMDPENLFGSQSRYLMNVILDAEEVHSKKWNLLILEDCGEMLTADAKERTGQGLSRLLNLVDGFIGQGLRCMILITTNEPVEKLHQAVSRPGRCTMRLDFPLFPVDEANAWLKAQAGEGQKPAPLVTHRQSSLADLYAILNNWNVETPKSGKVGF